jgi:predicted dienelactone hydrolase
VGVRTFELLDSSRRKPDGSPRRLLTEVWYPAGPEARELPFDAYDPRALLSDEQKEKLAHKSLPVLETRAVRDVSVSDWGPFPVLLFSHGQGGIRWQSTCFTVLAASHGYVVVSVDHEGNTIADALRDGLSLSVEGIESRPRDVTFLLNWLSGVGPEHPLHGQVDLERVGMAGHSFGALTALRAAALDDRIDVIVPQTPVNLEIAWIGLPRPLALDIPVMLQGARKDKTLKWDEHVVPAWEGLSRPRYLLELVTGGHFSYSDLCGLDLATIAREVELPQAADVESVLQDGCGPTAPPASVAQPIINHYALALFNSVLRESEGSREYLNQSGADRLGPGVALFTADP